MKSVTTSWNTRLRELAGQSLFSQALCLYRSMLRSAASPEAFSFPFALKSCAALSLPISGQQIHCHVIRTGCESEPFVLTALISMYSKSRFVDDARKVFDENRRTSSLRVCYNALISGYVTNSRALDSVQLFREMLGSGVSVDSVTILGLVPVCTVPEYFGLGLCLHCLCVKIGFSFYTSVLNSFLTMYLKCGSVEHARNLFDETPGKGLITWNAMISGYAQNGLAYEVLDLYERMKRSGFTADPVTLVSVLSSCAHIGAQRIGREIDQLIRARGFDANPFLNNALINMYARCGNLSEARQIFDAMPEKSLVSWTAIIGGYGMHGRGKIGLQLFDEMVQTGIKADGAVFVIVLSACSHAGLTDKGLEYFYAMERGYGLRPGPEHYSCTVDLLGRAGRINEARQLIDSMPVKADGAVWGALLGACKIHRNIGIAEEAFEQVIKLEPSNIGYYVLMSNIYSQSNNLEGVSRVRKMMKERRLRKEPGYSYVEHNGKVHLFLAGDRSHEQREEIHRVLDELEIAMAELDEYKDSNLQQEGSEKNLIHSERLAIAFGVLNTSPGAEIVVMKNLRVCDDCHLFIKLASSILDRQFTIRDATRFHHFRGGACSCGDYW